MATLVGMADGTNSGKTVQKKVGLTQGWVDAMAGFDALLNNVFNNSPLLNQRRPQASQIGDVTLCRATAHPGQQNALVAPSVSLGAFEGLAVAGEGHAGVQRFDPALERSRSRLTV